MKWVPFLWRKRQVFIFCLSLGANCWPNELLVWTIITKEGRACISKKHVRVRYDATTVGKDIRLSIAEQATANLEDVRATREGSPLQEDITPEFDETPVAALIAPIEEGTYVMFVRDVCLTFGRCWAK